ncbi:DUF1284 domain-containing protein [Alicyclobacillus sendaiensis]|uniref:DUF1284 domain-containing protein n=1 Tax=Alicyclobacillus sendaiensis TaxID=192387 RepID=UPI000785B77C|nr:DUF1284 domain-containing protein [Alicyclobacillus sendaiensis]
MIRLRGHHLLCLLGYRGMGYSEAYVRNMTEVYETLRTKPQTRVCIVAGPDDLCHHFPDNQPYHCQSASVHRRDAKVLARLGLRAGQCLPWREIERRVRDRVRPEDIRSLCHTCSWRSLGVCEEGVDLVRRRLPLPPAPPPP